MEIFPCASLIETFNSLIVPSRRRGHSIRTVSPQPNAGQECLRSPIGDISGCVEFFEMDPQHLPRRKVYRRSPVYTPASSQTPPRPSSRPRSASRPSDRRISHPGATVRVINPFSPQTVSVWLAPLRTSCSRSKPYRPGGMVRDSSTAVFFQENFSPFSILYHPAMKVIDRKPNGEAPFAVVDAPLEGNCLPPLNVRKRVEHADPIL